MNASAHDVTARARAAIGVIEQVRASLQGQRDTVLAAVTAVLIPSASHDVLDNASALLNVDALSPQRLLSLIEPRRQQLLRDFTHSHRHLHSTKELSDDSSDDDGLTLEALIAMRAGLLATRDALLFDIDQRRAVLAGAPTSSIATIDQHETQSYNVSLMAKASLGDEVLEALENTLLLVVNELADNARLMRRRKEAEEGIDVLDAAVIEDARAIARDTLSDWLRTPAGAVRFDTDMAPAILRADDTSLGVLRAVRSLSDALRIIDELRQRFVDAAVRARRVSSDAQLIRRIDRAELLARAALSYASWSELHEADSVWDIVFAPVAHAFVGDEEDDRSGAFLDCVLAYRTATLTAPVDTGSAFAEANTHEGAGAWLTQAGVEPQETLLRTAKIGARIGRYVIKRRLGGGGMGDVFLAKQDGPRGFQKKVVVKTIRSTHADDPSFISLFQREASLVARLNHPSVITILDVGVCGGRWYMAVEYLDGVSGMVLLPNSAMLGRAERASADIVACVLADAASGLAHAHERGVVHRDVSPDNVMVLRSGRSKLIDFGVASALDDDLENEKVLMGKLPYMAPELLTGGAITPACDIWGLGVTLHQVLTGKRPFDAATQAATVLRITNEGIDLGRLRLEHELRALLAGALDKDPASRPSAFEFATTLRDLACHDVEVAQWLERVPALPQESAQELH